MIKLTGFLILSLSILASLADATNETVLNKTRRNHKKDIKHEYYLNQHVDHPDVDAEAIQKHGASLEDAKMQADGLLEPKNKKAKTFEAVESRSEEAEGKLQEMAHNGEEKPHQRRRHHRHGTKVHEAGKSEKGSGGEEIAKKEEVKEKKLTKSRKTVDTSKSEDVKVDTGSTETGANGGVKYSGGKRNHHDKRRKLHKDGGHSGHKNKKHGGKKSHKPLGKPTKERKEKKIRKTNHQN